MEITNVRVKRINVGHDYRLVGLASVEFDNDLKILNIKIIKGHDRIFAVMPYRIENSKCHKCSSGNHPFASFCNWCGENIERENSETKDYLSVSIPIVKCLNRKFFLNLEEVVLKEFHRMENQNG